MQLTKQNARKYIGKILDVLPTEFRRWHHYPLKVVLCRDGVVRYCDATGTYMTPPDEDDIFNMVFFNTVKEED